MCPSDGRGGRTRTCMSFRTMDFKSIAYCQVSPRPHDIGPDDDYAIAVVVPMSNASEILEFAPGWDSTGGAGRIRTAE